ncbi:TPA: hypothetical protein HA241_00160 [Candidatus Woesearchaeota archaeon]|nr:hypothetical protein [Candidatus Woesearchaeota archaeon]
MTPLVQDKLGRDFGKERSLRRDHLLDQEVTIRIQPRKVLKWGIIGLLFVAFFFLGRMSMDCTVDNNEITTPEVAVAPAPIVAESEEPGRFSIGAVINLIGSLFSSDDNSSAVVAVPVVPSNGTVVPAASAPSNTTTPNPATTTTAEPEVEEAVITSYSKVALSLESVYTKWYDTWGKIMTITYTIKNNEVGTIKPSYIIMNVEGYDDFDKKINVHNQSKIIKAGAKSTKQVTVQGGFSYSEVSAGDLTSVDIVLELYDENGKLMTTVTKKQNLKGS